MSITNGYLTLEEFKRDKRIESTDSRDDLVIEDIITDASRLIDSVCGRTFYARAETRYYDIPYLAFSNELVYSNAVNPSQLRQELFFDDDLLTITTLTHGTAQTIASSEYILLPYNRPAKESLRFKQSSSVSWLPDASGNLERVIIVAGTWGYIDRAATDAYSVEVLRNTRMACQLIAVQNYLQRFGKMNETATITGAGVVITPHGNIPKEAMERIQRYVKVNV